MIKPIAEASYEEVVRGEILCLNRRSKWFVGRTVREGWENKGFKFFSLEKDNCFMRTYKDKHHAIDTLKGCKELSLYVCDNLIDLYIEGEYE